LAAWGANRIISLELHIVLVMFAFDHCEVNGSNAVADC
jgi:hypothetical protein